MVNRLLFGALTLSLLVASGAYAQIEGGVESFKQDPNAWRRVEEKQVKRQVTPLMRDSISLAALKNILESEQAFCYNVSSVSEGSDAYTVDGLEVTGFCGILPPVERDLFIDEYLSNDENISNVVEDCVIQPRIMLRFIRGIDYTDVLYSSPCHSFTVFYSGNIRSFNASPSAEIMDAIIEAYEGQKMPFVSPSLLGQVLPIGVPQTEEQKALVQEKNSKSQAAVRNWETNKPETPQNTQPAKKGWNNLKFKK